MKRLDPRPAHRLLGRWGSISIGLVFVLAGCSTGSATGPTWTFGAGLPPAATGAPSSIPSPGTPAPTVTPAPTATPVAATPSPSLDPNATPKPFSGRMTPHVLLVDGYVTMYMELVNTGSEPLTFINTLYDIEPDKLYTPTVAYPWTAGETALVTRAGRFFPSPAIVAPGGRAVYMMGGQLARGAGDLATPVANIKFCPTRGMDDVPSVPVKVSDVKWSTSGGLTTVTGTLTETEGSRRSSAPVVGVVFFDKAGAFVGSVVDARTGDRLDPDVTMPFSIEGRGVDGSRIDHAEAFAYVS